MFKETRSADVILLNRFEEKSTLFLLEKDAYELTDHCLSILLAFMALAGLVDR